jgi:hypothetical protein
MDISSALILAIIDCPGSGRQEQSLRKRISSKLFGSVPSAGPFERGLVFLKLIGAETQHRCCGWHSIPPGS